MTKKQFKQAMQCGLGRCILELDCTANIEKYYDIVLWGCKHYLSFDVQCEGTRGWYMYELIKRFPEKTVFLETISRSFEKSARNRYWDFQYSCSLLVRFAIDGSQLAKDALWKVYQELYQALYRRKRPPRTAVFAESEAFECLCTELIGLEEQCGDIYLRIAEDIGNLYLHSPVFKNWVYTFDGFYEHCRQVYGKRHMKNVLKDNAEKSPAIARYTVQSEHFKEEQDSSLREYHGIRLQTAMDIYQFF